MNTGNHEIRNLNAWKSIKAYYWYAILNKNFIRYITTDAFDSNINSTAKWHNLNNRGCNPRSTINWMSQPWRGWIFDLYIEFIIQPLRGCQQVFLSLPWVAPTVIQIKPLRGKQIKSGNQWTLILWLLSIIWKHIFQVNESSVF